MDKQVILLGLRLSQGQVLVPLLLLLVEGSIGFGDLVVGFNLQVQELVLHLVLVLWG